MSRNSDIARRLREKPGLCQKNPGIHPAGYHVRKATGAADICFLVRITFRKKKKDRNFTSSIRYLFIAIDLYEFLSAEAHYVSNQTTTRDLQRDPAQNCPVPQFRYNQG
jgi:hypothetical protein